MKDKLVGFRDFDVITLTTGTNIPLDGFDMLSCQSS